MALCLVVEDAPQQARILAETLRVAGHEVVSSATAAEARRLCEQGPPEIILLDLGLPDAEGLDLIPELLRLSPHSRIIVTTGRNSVPTAVAALRSGARHYLVKPWEREELVLVVEREGQAAAVDETRRRESQSDVFWGQSSDVGRLRSQLGKLASSPLTPVLIEAETGTGKEVLARALNEMTPGAGPFVPLNCAAVPSELLESEVFGHERGAYTGATARRRGLAELARGGTLFLDEVGEMAPALQSKLLRFLQDSRFRRVGGENELESRCRVVAATHRDLRQLQTEGRFREDLYFRLAVVRLWIPPLRERPEDLVPLARFLLERLARHLGRPCAALSPEAERAIRGHPWPGNVRELKNRLERALVLGERGSVDASDLDLETLPGSDHRPPVRTAAPGADGDEAERLCRVLREERWNVARAARRLGVPRHWVRYRMVKYRLSPGG